MSKHISDARPVVVARIAAHVRVPLFRNAYALIFGSTATSVLGIVYWALAARYYTADALGLNSAAIAGLMFLSGVSGLYLDGALVRFVPRAGRATTRLVSYTYLISVIVAALVSLVFLVGIDIWSPALRFLRESPWWMLGFVIASMTSCIFVLEDGVLTGLRQAVWIPIENTSFAVVKIVLLVLFAGRFPQYGIFASWIVPIVVLIVPVNLFIFRRLIPRHRRETEDRELPVTLRQIVTYITGNYLGYLCLLAYLRLLPIMVIQRTGSTASAFFYLPWVIATSLQLLTMNMNQSLVVEGSLDQTKLLAYGRQAIVHMMRLLVPIVAFLVFGAPYILGIFGDSYATEGTDLLRLLALSVLPNVVCSLYFGMARVRHRIGQVILGQAALAALVLGLSYLLLPRYGITGVGIACLASQSSLAAVLLLTRPGLLFRWEK